MKRLNLILFFVNLAFFLGLIGVSLYAGNIYSKHEKSLQNFESIIKGTELEELFALSGLIPTTLWAFLFGLVVFLILSLVTWMELKKSQKAVLAAENEKNSYKAQLYDMKNKAEEVTSGTEDTSR